MKVQLLYLSADTARLQIHGSEKEMIQLFDAHFSRTEVQTPQSVEYAVNGDTCRISCGQIVVSGRSSVATVLESIYRLTGRPENEAAFSSDD